MVRTFISLSSLHLKEGDFSLFMQNIKNLMRNCVPVLCLNYCSAFAKSTRRLHWPWTIMARRLLRLACRSPHTVGEQKEVCGADFVVPREGANNKCFCMQTWLWIKVSLEPFVMRDEGKLHHQSMDRGEHVQRVTSHPQVELIWYNPPDPRMIICWLQSAKWQYTY